MFTILWDNDGVLVDTEGLYFRATKTVLATVGIDLTPEQFKDISLRRGESTFRLAAEAGIGAEEIARLRAERDRIYSESLAAMPCVIDGAEEVLRSLHGRVRMGVVTSTRRRHFDIAHAKSGLTKYLDFVLAFEDYRHTKPQPRTVPDGNGPTRPAAPGMHRRRGFGTGTGCGDGGWAAVPDRAERMDQGW